MLDLASSNSTVSSPSLTYQWINALVAELVVHAGEGLSEGGYVPDEGRCHLETPRGYVADATLHVVGDPLDKVAGVPRLESVCFRVNSIEQACLTQYGATLWVHLSFAVSVTLLFGQWSVSMTLFSAHPSGRTRALTAPTDAFFIA
jgi:hypothetical protein